MTNLQEGAKPPSRLGRTALLLGLPISAGLLLSAVVVVGAVWQPWSRLREGQNQLHALRAMEQRLPLLREQRLRQLEAAEKTRGQQADLLQLIAGSGELSTFLAQLVERPARRASNSTCSNPPHIRGQGHGQRQLPPHPQPRGKRPRPRGIPWKPRASARAQHC